MGMTTQGSQPLRSAWGAWNVTPTILVPRFLILLSKHLLVTPFWKSPHIESMHLHTSSVPAGLQHAPEGRPPKCGPGCRGKLMVPKLSDAGDPGLGALCSLSFRLLLVSLGAGSLLRHGSTPCSPPALRLLGDLTLLVMHSLSCNLNLAFSSASSSSVLQYTIFII